MSRDSSKYVQHIEDYTSRTMSRLAWGAPDHSSELRVGTFGLLTTISPSGQVPNVVSPLAKIPAWLSPWKKCENLRHDREERFFDKAFMNVKSAVAKGVAKPSYMKMFFEDKLNEKSTGHGPAAGIQDKEGKHVVGMMAIAGALTIGSPLQSYILTMCHYPWWQVRIREEIQMVCGDRCLEWSDFESLPTLRAVMKEVMRWRPPVPTGIPHALEKDDIYDGYFIPKGATIHALEWYIFHLVHISRSLTQFYTRGMTRDPLTYPDPDTFRPER